MLIFAARRIIQAIPILLGVSLVVFGLVHIVPGNPIDLLMPPEASPEVIAQMKAAFGFDKPLYLQYLLWLGRALRGDFGLSVFNATPVWGQLMTALGNTFVLAILAAMLGFTLGIIFGLLSAVFHGRWPDKLFSAIATTGVSLPHYWCAIVLVLACAVLHDWLPAQGMGDDSLPLYDRLQYLVLPVVNAVAHPDGRHRPSGARDRAGNPQPGIRRRADRQGPDALAGDPPHLQERRPAGAGADGTAVRLPARRLDPGGDGVQLARLRQPAQPRDLPPRHPGAAGDDPGARLVLRRAQPVGRYRPGGDRSAHPPVNAMSQATVDLVRRELAPVEITPVAATPGYWKSVGQRLMRDPVTIAVTVVLLGIIFISMGAPLVAGADPYAGSVLARLKPIGTPGHWLGTDETGRDLWARLCYGGRLSLLAGILPVSISLVVGGFLGILAGYAGGLVGTLIMRTMDVFYAFPSILLAIAICGLLGNGLSNSVIALSVVFIPPMVRISETVTTQARHLDFVEAARASGTTTMQIIRHHVLANVLGPILVYATSLISVSIILSAGLSFLGLGVTPPQAEWGLMLNSLRQAIYVQPYVAALPGVMIFITSMCFNLMSDGFRSAMDVRLNK